MTPETGDGRPPADPPGSSGAALRGAALVTGNRNKLLEARRLCGFNLEAVELDLPEIQSLDIRQVVAQKGAEAFRRLQRPVIVEETGLELAALNRFPGPLVKWMLAAVGAEGIARTATALGITRATARCVLLFLDGRRTVAAEGSTVGRLVLPPRGDRGFGWGPIFQPDGESRTFAELDGPDKDRCSHRGRAWRELVARLARR